MGYILKFTNTVSPPPPPPPNVTFWRGRQKKIFDANAPTSSPQTSDQVSANVINIRIIGLYGTPAVRQAVLRLALYIRPIRFEDSIRTKKYDSQGPNVNAKLAKVPRVTKG